MNRHIIIEGLRIGLHGLRCHFTGPKRYQGSPEEICQQIVEACWDESLGIFITSLHNYPLFYSRDFGMCVESLLRLGHRERVRKTLAWALDKYSKAGRVTQIIRRNGRAYNFPDAESPDALAFLLHSLDLLKDKALLDRYKGFLEKELQRFTTAVVDEKTGLCKRGMHLGGMRDYAVRDSSCYDNVMLAAIKKYSERLKMENPLRRFDYERLIPDNFWTGSHFKDDLVNDELTGDANVLPFWFGILPKEREKRMFKKALKEIQELRLDRPLALRYEPSKNSSVKMHWMDPLTGSWETDTVWIHLGNLFLQVAAKLDTASAKRYLRGHKRLIEQEQHYPELLNKEGKPFKALFLHSDDSMLWACNFLSLSPMLERPPRQ